MERESNRLARKLVERAKKSRFWHRLIAVLAVVTVLVTTNQLKFLVDALSRVPTCGIEEHEHDASCYDDEGALICGMEEHVHTDACYQQRPVAADSVEDAVSEQDAVDIEGDPEEAAVPQVEADVGGDEVPEYVFDLNGSGSVALDDILAGVGLQIGGISEVGECVYYDDQPTSIEVRQVDHTYFIVPSRDFIDDDWVELGVIADDGVYVIKLLNGVVPAPVSAPAFEMAELPDDSGEDASEPEETQGKAAEEKTEEKAEEVTEEKTEEVTEEKTEEVTEEKTEEVTEEKTEEVTEEKAEEATPVVGAARTCIANIDLTDAEAPLSLAALMAKAEPVEAEAPAQPEEAEQAEEAEQTEEADQPEAPAQPEDGAADPADWRLSFDEALFTAEAVEGDWLLTPVASFETATIRVEAGDSYVLNLNNYALPETWPAQSFEGRTATMTVKVTAEAGAFPEGTTMTVADIDDESTIGDIAGAVEADNTAVKRVHAVDITFFNRKGEVIEPLIPISVIMTVNEMANREDAVVVHVDDAGNATQVDGVDVSPEEVAFDADAFSVYAVVVTEHYISADGQRFAIQLTYGADAGIPANATLKVTEVEDPAYLDQTVEAVGDGCAIRLARYFDIDIIADGLAIQPTAPVEVRVALEDAVEADRVCAVHFGEGDPTLIDAETGDSGVVTFEAEGFSVYGIVYTVDFAYNVNGKIYEYSIPGGETVPLSEVVEALHIIEAAPEGAFADAADFCARVTDVAFTDPELLEPLREDGVWMLKSLAPFQTVERLDITMDDGERFSVTVTDAQLKKCVIAASGEAYMVTVTYDTDSGIPEDADLTVEEILGEDRDDYVGRAAAAMQTGGFEYGRVFDITIVDAEGQKLQPAAPVDVAIELMDADPESGDFDVVHFAGGDETAQQVTADTDENTVRFNAESFSAYAIVRGPEPAPVGWERLTSLEDLATYGEQGLYIGHYSGYYYTDGTWTSNKNRTGIVKTMPAQSWPADGAAVYYFIKAGDADDVFYVRCGQGENARYVRNDGTNSLYLDGTEATKTAFTVEMQDDKFRLHNGEWYWNMSGGLKTVFCSYNTREDDNNLMTVWRNVTVEADPYGLGGKKYGLIAWNGSVTGKAMMADDAPNAANALQAMALTVLTKAGDRSNHLFVPDQIDDTITGWSFEWAGNDRYYISANTGLGVKYLKLSNAGPSLVDAKGDAGTIRVIPGSDEHAGQIRLENGGATLTYSGAVETGFGLSGPEGGEWLNLAQGSDLPEGYFMTYSARKISVSDARVDTNVMIYTRDWNEANKRYDYYAVAADGRLVPCFETGDTIEWVGERANTMLWRLSVDEKEGFYNLYNPYSQLYISPRLSEDRVLSDALGEDDNIILPGRQYGDYYSPIMAWDESANQYAGLKVENGQIVPCDKDEAMDFYFGELQDLNIDDTLTTVKTLNNGDYGIRMWMRDIGTRQEMDDMLGNDDGGLTRQLVQGLLTPTLGDDGYPRAIETDRSLADLLAGQGRTEADGLFIDSTYRASGYFEYDSTQNFASLKGNRFTVYQELGSYDIDKRKTLKHGQFFPYNDLTPGLFASVNRYNEYDLATDRPLSDSNPRKYEQLYLITDVNTQFGLEMEAGFVQTPDGLDDWGHDIIFEFSGDDDFWLYVDGNLVIDLGGIHSAVPGWVNFRTGQVYTNGEYSTLYECFYNSFTSPKGGNMTPAEAEAACGRIFKQNAAGQYVFKDNSQHVMRIFYFERGAYASNLRIRFNLSSASADTVRLTKKLKGVDPSQAGSGAFAFQIKYRNANDEEKYVTNMSPNDPNEVENHVFLNGNPLPYKKEHEIDGVKYEHVFFLKPDETAEIKFTEKMGAVSYQVIECGVDTDTYSGVYVNDVAVQGTVVELKPNRRNYASGYDTIENRANIEFTNEVSQKRPLTIRKRLFDANGTELQLSEGDPDLDREFSFCLYLDSEHAAQADAQAVTPAYLREYHVKTPAGVYCVFDKVNHRFVPIEGNITDYAQIPEDRRKDVAFPTGTDGSISRIPPGYIVEFRELPVGTRFRVVEPAETVPDGYRFMKYVVNGTDCEVIDGMTGQITADAVSHVDVCNYKGYALTLEKSWTDADFVQRRDPAYFAVYNGETLVEGTVRRLAFDQPQKLRWHFDRLPQGANFNNYAVFEVRVSGDQIVDDDGVVTGYTGVTRVPEGDDVELNVLRKAETDECIISYVVHYDAPVPTGDNARLYAVENRSIARPHIRIRKQDWSENWLAGAAFTVSDPNGNKVGTYTSNAEGYVADLYLVAGKAYTLEEITAPAGYTGLPARLTFRVDISGEEPNITETIVVIDPNEALKGYHIENKLDTDGVPLLIVKDRPWTLEAVKVDAMSGAPLAGVEFALYRQTTIGNTTRYVPYKAEGTEYTSLKTDINGVIPKVDQRLEPGKYELQEKQPLSGYQTCGYIHFEITETGKIALGECPEGVKLEQAEETADEPAHKYTLRIPNRTAIFVSIWKTSMPDYGPLTGASFALYFDADYDPETNRLKDVSCTGEGAPQPLFEGKVEKENGILRIGNLGAGRYRLFETQAPEGYHSLETPLLIVVTPGSKDAVSAMQGEQMAMVSTSANAYKDHFQADQDISAAEGQTVSNTWQIHVGNNPGVSLPSTGGYGTGVLHAAGLGLVLLAVCGFLYRLRKRCQEGRI